VEGRHADAVEWFSRILEVADAGRTRLELARSLAALGRREEAKIQYRAVLERDPPPSIRGWIRSEMAQLDSDGPASANTTFRLGLGALWDSNATVGPADPNITLFGLPFELTQSSLGRADSGALGWFGVDSQIETGLGLVALGARVEFTRYREQQAQNSQVWSAQAAMIRAFGATQWTVSALVNSNTQSSGQGRTSGWLAVRALRPLGTAQSVSLQLARGTQSDRGNANPRTSLLSWSPTWVAGLGYGIESSVSLKSLRQTAVEPDQSHRDWGFEAELRGPAPVLCASCSWSVHGDATRARYDGQDFLFDVQRSDRLQALSVALRGDWSDDLERGRFRTWSLNIDWTKNQSNIPLNEYRRARVTITNEWVF
jgi:hypothetical protein